MEQKDRQERVHAQIVDGLFRQASGGLVATLINAGIVVAVLWEEVPATRAAVWLGAMLLIVVVRAVVLVAYRRGSPSPESTRVWEHRFVLGLFCSGVLWGSSAVFIFPENSMAHQALLAIVLTGMSAGAVGSFSNLVKAFALFTVPALIPLIVRFSLFPDSVHRALAFMMILFIGLTLSAARRTSRANRERLELKEHFGELLEERTEELTHANERLREEIEKHERTETALTESETRYRDLFDHIPDLLYMHDFEGRFLEANRAWEAYGYDRAELKGLLIKTILAERYRDAYDAYLQRLSETGWDEGFMRLVTKDGRECVVEYRNDVVRDEAGNPTAVRGAGRDVTERIQSRKEKEALQAQLMKAQRLEAIGTLAGGIAHNFNNLLMGIQGNASLGALEIGGDHPLAGRLEKIERLVDRGSRLTSQLLAYAREGKVQVQPLDLNPIIQGMASTFAETRKDIRTRLELAEGLWFVEADSGQIRQAVMNLCVNGADAMPGGGELVLSTRNISEEDSEKSVSGLPRGNYVQVQVMDSGIGMDQDLLTKVFDPFFTTKEVGKGTGLGLASVQGIVESHGGLIHANSEVGCGTSFTIYLPALLDHRREEKVLKEERTKEGPLTVLLVDDESMILDVGVQMLEALGYRVLEANSGPEAIRIFGEHQDEIDLVILDMVMPDLSGGATFDRLKEMSPDVRVLLSSGYSIDGEASEILKRGCGGFIQKPFQLSDLSKTLEDMLGVPRAS